MQQDRRKFLRGLAAACATGIGHGLTRSTTLVAAGAATGAAAAQATAAVAASTVVPTYIYGAGVRGQVFEVVVRQALAGAPWKEICHGPMHVNNITPEEIEKEVERRKAIVHDTDFPTACQCVSCVKARDKLLQGKVRSEAGQPGRHTSFDTLPLRLQRMLRRDCAPEKRLADNLGTSHSTLLSA